MYSIDKKDLKDHNGRYRTQSLFYETNHSEMEAMLSLKDYNFKKNDKIYYSLKLIYLSYEDITEYQFALDVFGSWKHWNRIKSNALLAPYIQEWADELEVKIRSNAIRAMVKTAASEGSKGISAAKWLADRKWQSKDSKKEATHNKKIEKKIKLEIKDDAERLGIH